MVRFPPFPAGLGIGFASEEKGISPRLPFPLCRDLVEMLSPLRTSWTWESHPWASGTWPKARHIQVLPCCFSWSHGRCCPVSFNSMSLSPGRWLCLQQGIHIPALYLDTSHISRLVPGRILQIQLLLRRSFPLCGQLTDVLAFLITCLSAPCCL